MEKKQIERRSKFLLSVRGFGDWIPATYVLFLAEKGLSQLQINSINTFFMLGNFVFEPISGYVQDIIGQIQIYWIGLFCWATSFLMYYFGGSYWEFVAAEIVGAIGMAACVGSLEAFLDNKVGPARASKARKDGRSMRMFFAMIPASLGSFAAARWGLGFPWLLSSVSNFVILVITVLVSRKMIGYPDIEQEHQDLISKVNFFTGLNFVLKDPFLLLVTASTFVTKFFFQAYNMTWSRIFSESIEEKFLGLLWIGVSLTVILGSQVAKLVPHNKWIVCLSLVGLALPMLIGSMVGSSWIMIACFYVHEIFRAIFYEALETSSAERIPNKIRSSTRSVIQAVGMLGAMTGLPFSGWLGDKIGLVETWSVVSACLVVFAGFLVLQTLLSRRKL